MPDPTSEQLESAPGGTPAEGRPAVGPPAAGPGHSAASRLILAALLGVGVKKRPKPKKKKKKRKAAPVPAEEPAAGSLAETVEGPAKKGAKAPVKKRPKRRRRRRRLRPARTQEQIERARRIRSRVWAAIAIALVLGVGGALGGGYLWSRLVTVPDLVGKSQEEARSVLEASGLGMGVISETYVGDEGQFPTGTVLAHVPAYGVRVAPGAPVAVTVVAGPVWVRMPRLAGLTVGQAFSVLDSLDMTASVVDPVTHVQPASDYVHGMGFRVASSSVPAGARVERGMLVMLTVDRRVADTERRFIFGHPHQVQEKGADNCYPNCHQERDCSRCHLRVLGGLELPEGVTAGEFIRDQALDAAGLRTDAKRPRFVRVEARSDSAYEVVLNADSAAPADRRGPMLSATMELFKRLLGRGGIKELTVRWIDAATRRSVMTVRMTDATLWSNQWSGLPPDQLPQLADYFAE